MSNIHILNEKSLGHLKNKAKKIASDSSISQTAALNIVANSIGFSCWKDVVNVSKFESSGSVKMVFEKTNTDLYSKFLNHCNSDNKPTLDEIRKHYSALIVDEYTDLQKIGAIARSVGINPANLKSTIHILLSTDEDIFELMESDWESMGLFQDQRFSESLQKEDPFFYHYDTFFSFRLLSVDTLSFVDVYEHLKHIYDTTHSKIPLAVDHIWINGKIDPIALTFSEEDKEYFPDLNEEDELLPLAQLPESVWKRSY